MTTWNIIEHKSNDNWEIKQRDRATYLLVQFGDTVFYIKDFMYYLVQGGDGELWDKEDNNNEASWNIF